jgi:hypothetical protein
MYVFMYERPYRLHGFLQIMHHLDDKNYWELLGSIWSDSENIWQNFKVWLKLLADDRPGKEHFMDAEEREALAKLPDVLVVHRGYVKGKNKNGLSYTLSKEKAEWFAKRFSNGNPAVCTRRVKKTDVLAYLTGRGEDEIVLKPEALK